MKNWFLFEGTISGKTALFRYFLLLVFTTLNTYSPMYFIGWIIVYLELTTIYKRLGAFKNSNNWFGQLYSNYRKQIIGFSIILNLYTLLGLNINFWDFFPQLLLLIYFLFVILFEIIPSLLNSPISDHKEKKEW
tara:strand:+ start:642 stop:1043 length:402 start_codon:yes stop_codon:yes gene_type:complete